MNYNSSELSSKGIIERIAILLVLVIIVLGVNQSINFTASNPASGGLAKVVLDESGRKRIFEGGVIDGMTVLEAIYTSSLAGKFDFYYSVNNNKIEVIKIGESIKESGSRITISLNGRNIDESKIDEIKINQGDVVEIKTEKIQ